jgi:hypothetical protein
VLPKKMQLTVHWSRLARLSAYALLALVAFLAVLQLFLPVSLVAVFYDICEMIEVCAPVFRCLRWLPIFFLSSMRLAHDADCISIM